MKGTKEALDILGVSGTVKKKTELPDGYDVERKYSYSKIQQKMDDSENLSEFRNKISKEMDETQDKFEAYKKQVEEELEKFDNGDKVKVVGNIQQGTIGKVNGYEVDRGHVFYHIYDLDGADCGHIRADALEEVES